MHIGSIQLSVVSVSLKMYKMHIDRLRLVVHAVANTNCRLSESETVG